MPPAAYSGLLGVRPSNSEGTLFEARWKGADGQKLQRTGFASADAAAKFYDAQVLGIDPNACVC